MDLKTYQIDIVTTRQTGKRFQADATLVGATPKMPKRKLFATGYGYRERVAVQRAIERLLHNVKSETEHGR